MLRITRTEFDHELTTLRLEGRVTHAEIGALDLACQEGIEGGRRLVLDLVGVSFVDGAGAVALSDLRRRRVELTGCSPFVSELLREVS
jgi:anti-anti-sigma regulatory factor